MQNIKLKKVQLKASQLGSFVSTPPKILNKLFLLKNLLIDKIWQPPCRNTQVACTSIKLRMHQFIRILNYFGLSSTQPPFAVTGWKVPAISSSLNVSRSVKIFHILKKWKKDMLTTYHTCAVTCTLYCWKEYYCC